MGISIRRRVICEKWRWPSSVRRFARQLLGLRCCEDVSPLLLQCDSAACPPSDWLLCLRSFLIFPSLPRCCDCRCIVTLSMLFENGVRTFENDCNIEMRGDYHLMKDCMLCCPVVFVFVWTLSILTLWWLVMWCEQIYPIYALLVSNFMCFTRFYNYKIMICNLKRLYCFTGFTAVWNSILKLSWAILNSDLRHKIQYKSVLCAACSSPLLAFCPTYLQSHLCSSFKNIYLFIVCVRVCLYHI